MYEEWTFFSTFLNNVEATLSKTDLAVAREYVERLVDPSLHYLFDTIVTEYQRTVTEILWVTQRPSLLSNQPTLVATQQTRDHYLRPLQLLQIQLLERVRSERQAGAAVDDVAQRALLLTINAIAAGLRNTG